MIINGNTKLIGFIGKTYKTSKMYALYNAAFTELQLNYVYIPLVVTNISEAVSGIRGLGLHAVGVTIPYKIDIIPFLDEIEEEAKQIGAINFVLNDNKKLIGGNTDGLGGLKALQEETNLSQKKVVLLGAGGAARALAFAIQDAGAQIVILNRSNGQAEELANKVGCQYGSLSQLPQVLTKADIIIQATNVGMYSDSDSLIPKELIPHNVIVMDIVTKPRETKLIRDAKAKECKIIYGERMLFWQAVLKFSKFTGEEPPTAIMENVLKQTL